MTAYQVFLNDDINVVELDCEDIDVHSLFSVNDIRDITSRQDSIKSIKFKGTSNNNHIFGSYFDLGRTTDFNDGNRLYFNHNPLRSVNCTVFENSMLIFRGSLRIVDYEVKDGNITYNTIVTGALTDLKKVIQDKTLNDLDFSDMTHRYSLTNIVNSWSASTEISTSASTYTTTQFQYGKNYVYGCIDFGYGWSAHTGTTAELNLKNFKPSIFLVEYMNRIFQQDGLSGYTYEIKGDSGFTEMFKHLIIPDSQEGNKQRYSSTNIKYKISNHTFNPETMFYGSGHVYYLDIGSTTNTSSFANAVQYSYNARLRPLMDFTTEINYSSFFTVRNKDASAAPITLDINIGKKPITGSTYTVIGTQSIVVPYTTGTLYSTFNININVPNAMYYAGEEIAVWVETAILRQNVSFETLTSNLDFTPTLLNAYDVTLDPTLGIDEITPLVPQNIKQLDFLSSIIKQFNFMVYTDKNNYKHLVFERYNDFYALCQPQYIKNNALNWTKKVDYKNGFKFKSNIDLPKAYLFSYKDDTDYLTDYYKKRFNKVYGQQNLIDENGLLDLRKIESIFSPTVITSEVGTTRLYPLLYTKADNGEKKLSKTNPRLAYYNGLIECDAYTLANEAHTAFTPTYQVLMTGLTRYAEVSNFYRASPTTGSTIVNDIHFGHPDEFYFTASTTDFQTCSTSYSNYYLNQVYDLIHPDVKFFEGYILLDEVDMSIFDPKVPVFIDTGIMNASYFKVINVEYQGSDKPSKVMLQSIQLV